MTVIYKHIYLDLSDMTTNTNRLSQENNQRTDTCPKRGSQSLNSVSGALFFLRSLRKNNLTD